MGHSSSTKRARYLVRLRRRSSKFRRGRMHRRGRLRWSLWKKFRLRWATEQQSSKQNSTKNSSPVATQQSSTLLLTSHPTINFSSKAPVIIPRKLLGQQVPLLKRVLLRLGSSHPVTLNLSTICLHIRGICLGGRCLQHSIILATTSAYKPFQSRIIFQPRIKQMNFQANVSARAVSLARLIKVSLIRKDRVYLHSWLIHLLRTRNNS